jgi:hypothetical protein
MNAKQREQWCEDRYNKSAEEIAVHAAIAGAIALVTPFAVGLAIGLAEEAKFWIKVWGW